MLLADRRQDVQPRQRTLIARLAQGAAGKALGFDLESYIAARADALLLIRGASADPDHTALFKMTETYRAGAEGQQKNHRFAQSTLAPARRPAPPSEPARPNSSATPTSGPSWDRLSQTLSFQWIEGRLPRTRSGLHRHAPQPPPQPLPRRLRRPASYLRPMNPPTTQSNFKAAILAPNAAVFASISTSAFASTAFAFAFAFAFASKAKVFASRYAKALALALSATQQSRALAPGYAFSREPLMTAGQHTKRLSPKDIAETAENPPQRRHGSLPHRNRLRSRR